MSYKRRTNIYNQRNNKYNQRNNNTGNSNVGYSNTATKIFIHWSQKSGSYSVKYENLQYFSELQMFNQYMKTRPWGEYEYDNEHKIWYLHEKHLDGLIQMIELLGPNSPSGIYHFDIDLKKKPEGGNNGYPFQGQFVPIDKYKKIFSDISGEKLDGVDYKTALSIYRQTCRKLHPDIGGDTLQMSAFNEAWDVIKEKVYNIKRAPQEVEFA